MKIKTAIYPIILAGLLLPFLISCIKEDKMDVPTITLTPVTNITTNTAACGGEIISDGGSKVTARGVCWSTAHNPTVDDNKSTDGSGVGSFTSNLIGLLANTTYYVRSYATNTLGTGYTSEVEFKTSEFINETVTDIDGNVYHAVAIGTQVWVVENLKTTKYRNGNIIGTTTPATLNISSQSAPKYQWAYDGNEANVATYGRLYTWYAVTDSRGVCPIGWHVPSAVEWSTLITFLGEGDAGGKLKEASTSHWSIPNTGATNSSGFTALPGDSRNEGGWFGGMNEHGYWWSSSEWSALSVSSIVMFYNASDAVIDNGLPKKSGYSVRCIRD